MDGALESSLHLLELLRAVGSALRSREAQVHFVAPRDDCEFRRSEKGVDAVAAARIEGGSLRFPHLAEVRLTDGIAEPGGNFDGHTRDAAIHVQKPARCCAIAHAAARVISSFC